MGSKSDASKQILGFKYQEMVALKECFEAKDGTKIYLECFGDISDGRQQSTEVKQSTDLEKKLINTHVDFWKTLFNILTEYDRFRFYDKFILHTTAKIKQGSIFEGWGDLTKTDKIDKVISVNSNNSIKRYHDKVTSFDKEKLKGILDKFEIKDNQKPAQAYYQNILIEHTSVVNSIEPKNREKFICSMLGYISHQLINASNYIWEIDIYLFRQNFRSCAKNYQIEDLNFPIVNASDHVETKDNFRFVKELKSIEYEKKIGGSMSNYLRASASQVKMIEARFNLKENLENYDDDIKEVVLEAKDSHIDKLTEGCDVKEKSRRFFDDSINKITSKTKIQGVTEVNSYYPKGRFMHNIEIDNISINLNLKDEIK